MAQARRLEATVDFINVESGGSAAVTQARRREVASVMLDAASSLQLLDMRLARDTVLEAFPMAIYAGAFSSASPSDVARAAQTMRLADTVEPSAVDAVLDALADLFADGYAAAVPGLRSAVAALYGDAHARRYPRLLTFGLYAAFALGDDDSARRLARECVARGRAVDGWQVVAESLGYLGHCELRVGTLESADRYYTEVSDLGALLGHVAGADHAYKLVVAAWRGEANEVRAGAEVMSREGRERSVGYIVDKCDHAVALLELGLGNYHAASLRTSETFDLDLAFAPMRAADAVEAHVRGGDRRVAEGLVEWLTERATATQSPVDLGLLARARALTSDDARAEHHYVDGLTQLEKAAAALELARTQLVYGEWLRRQNRRRDARVQLTAAHETFESMGAGAFEQRTRIELLATGAHARKRTDDTRRDLTSQEEQIARLAAQGATQPGDRCPALHQPEHRRLPPAEGVHEAPDHVAARARPHAVRRE